MFSEVYDSVFLPYTEHMHTQQAEHASVLRVGKDRCWPALGLILQKCLIWEPPIHHPVGLQTKLLFP